MKMVFRIEKIFTIREAFNVVVHIDVVYPRVFLHQIELVTHADNGAA